MHPLACHSWAVLGLGAGGFLLLLHFSSDPVMEVTLARTFQGKFDKFVIPCVMASGDLRDERTETLSFRCRSRAPILVSWAGLKARHRPPSQHVSPLQSPQHSVSGAVVSHGGPIHPGDIQQRQDGG